MQAREVLAMIEFQNPQPIMYQSANFGVHTRQFKKVFELLKDFTNEIEHKSREVLYQICGGHQLSQLDTRRLLERCSPLTQRACRSRAWADRLRQKSTSLRAG